MAPGKGSLSPAVESLTALACTSTFSLASHSCEGKTVEGGALVPDVGRVERKAEEWLHHLAHVGGRAVNKIKWNHKIYSINPKEGRQKIKKGTKER